jgi:hypothetical protein
MDNSDGESISVEAAKFAYAKLEGIDWSQWQEKKPDADNRETQDIDRLLTNRSRRIAIEHSAVETYTGQLRYVNGSYDFIAAVSDSLSGKLKDDRSYVVVIPTELIIGDEKPKRNKLAKAIQDEILRNVETLDVDSDHSFSFNGSRITLYCERLDALEKGKVFRANTVPRDDLDKLFAVRIRELFNKKIPKLIKYKMTGAKTFLVVEDVGWKTGHGFPKKYIGLMNALRCWLFIDIIAFVRTNSGSVIYCNFWKFGMEWPKSIPENRRVDVMSLNKKG